MAEEATIEVPEEMEKFVSYIENLTVLDLSKLVKTLEDELQKHSKERLKLLVRLRQLLRRPVLQQSQ